MLNNSAKKRLVLLFAILVGATTACKKKDDDSPAPAASAFRPSMSTTGLTSTSPYNTTSTKTFTDTKGDSTVNRTTGRVRLAMLKALDAYAKKATTQEVTEVALKNMFVNTGNPFANTFLDASGLNIKEKTGITTSSPLTVQSKIESYFPIIADASKSFAVTAEKGKAGVLSFTNPTSGNLSKYLVDAKGIEYAQVIAKSLIGSFQLDYIGNTLLADLNADNSKVVTGQNYTQLEHNWDEAYGLFTANDIYALVGADKKASTESFLGSYVREYNLAEFPKFHEAFLRGRAAIVNNDVPELQKQSEYIRKEMEKSIAMAAVGYMVKASNPSATIAERAHAFGEGFGFVYALRFCKLNGADAAFSEEVKAILFPDDTTTFYDITATQFTAASNKIKTKFGL